MGGRAVPELREPEREDRGGRHGGRAPVRGEARPQGAEATVDHGVAGREREQRGDLGLLPQHGERVRPDGRRGAALSEGPAVRGHAGEEVEGVAVLEAVVQEPRCGAGEREGGGAGEDEGAGARRSDGVDDRDTREDRCHRPGLVARERRRDERRAAEHAPALRVVCRRERRHGEHRERRRGELRHRGHAEPRAPREHRGHDRPRRGRAPVLPHPARRGIHEQRRRHAEQGRRGARRVEAAPGELHGRARDPEGEGQPARPARVPARGARPGLGDRHAGEVVVADRAEAGPEHGRRRGDLRQGDRGERPASHRRSGWRGAGATSSARTAGTCAGRGRRRRRCTRARCSSP